MYNYCTDVYSLWSLFDNLSAPPRILKLFLCDFRMPSTDFSFTEEKVGPLRIFGPDTGLQSGILDVKEVCLSFLKNSPFSPNRSKIICVFEIIDPVSGISSRICNPLRTFPWKFSYPSRNFSPKK